MNWKAYPVLCVALLGLGFRCSNRVLPSLGISGHLLERMEEHACLLRDYSQLISKSASESKVDPRIVGAVLAAETWNRCASRRVVELRLAELFSVVNSLLGMRPVDMSVGIGQLKLTTARWIRSDFRTVDRSHRMIFWKAPATIESLAKPEENLGLVARYLAYLIRRRYGENARLIEEANTQGLAIVATEYHTGIRSLHNQPIDKYGQIVATFARSRALSEILGFPESADADCQSGMEGADCRHKRSASCGR